MEEIHFVTHGIYDIDGQALQKVGDVVRVTANDLPDQVDAGQKCLSFLGLNDPQNSTYPAHGRVFRERFHPVYVPKVV